MNKISVIFVRYFKEKINNKLFKLSKENNLNFFLFNFGEKLKTNKKRIFNIEEKFINKILEKVVYNKKSEFFLFVNVSASEIYFLDSLKRIIWYYEKFKEKAGVIDFTTSCTNFRQIIFEEPRLYPLMYNNLYKIFVANSFYFAVKKDILIESLSKPIQTKFFKGYFEYLASFICFYKKYLICKDTTYKIVLDNKKLKYTLKRNQSIMNIDKKHFEQYINFYFILFLEILVFIVWKIPSINFDTSTKTIGVLKPILKLKKLI